MEGFWEFVALAFGAGVLCCTLIYCIVGARLWQRHKTDPETTTLQNVYYHTRNHDNKNTDSEMLKTRAFVTKPNNIATSLQEMTKVASAIGREQRSRTVPPQTGTNPFGDEKDDLVDRGRDKHIPHRISTSPLLLPTPVSASATTPVSRHTTQQNTSIFSSSLISNSCISHTPNSNNTKPVFKFSPIGT